VRVRRALCMALDPRMMYEKLFFRLGALAPADQNPVTGWADPHVKFYPTDPAAAGRLLDAAGWKMGSGGIRIKNGRPLVVELGTVAGAKSNEQVEVAIQAAWRAIGVQTEVKNVPGDRYFAPANAGGTLNTGNYEVALFSWVRNLDPNDAAFLSPTGFPPHGENVSYYDNAEVTRLIEQGVSTFDLRRRHTIYDRIQQIIVRDLPYYTLLWIPVVTASDPHLVGVKPPPTLFAFWNITEWRWR
ncbi:MAG: hypothetical protein JOZ24_05775, partial [Candidatus Eremiobacteraeota bacterium]|nr:hypothetical protein [Candidatus Eremiobacteraeota bacterium]